MTTALSQPTFNKIVKSYLPQNTQVANGFYKMLRDRLDDRLYMTLEGAKTLAMYAHDAKNESFTPTDVAMVDYLAGIQTREDLQFRLMHDPAYVNFFERTRRPRAKVAAKQVQGNAADAQLVPDVDYGNGDWSAGGNAYSDQNDLNPDYNPRSAGSSDQRRSAGSASKHVSPQPVNGGARRGAGSVSKNVSQQRPANSRRSAGSAAKRTIERPVNNTSRSAGSVSKRVSQELVDSGARRDTGSVSKRASQQRPADSRRSEGSPSKRARRRPSNSGARRSAERGEARSNSRQIRAKAVVADTRPRRKTAKPGWMRDYVANVDLRTIKRDFVRVYVPKTYNNLFNAVRMATGETKTVQELRDRCATLAGQGHRFKPMYLQEMSEDDLKDHIKALKKREQGGELELRVLAFITNHTLIVKEGNVLKRYAPQEFPDRGSSSQTRQAVLEVKRFYDVLRPKAVD